MLGTQEVMGFVPTAEPEKARQFYEHVLGLTFIEDSPFALVFQANNATVRIAKMPPFEPVPYTILGWNVADIVGTVRQLREHEVEFQIYDQLEQDELGIWASPSGARVAWFKDPDGNTLSLTQP